MSQISPPIRILLVAVIGLLRRLHALPQAEGRDGRPPPPRPRPRRRRSPPRTPAPRRSQQAGRDRPEGRPRHADRVGPRRAGRRHGLGIDDGKTDGTTSVGPASTGVNTNPVTKAPATGETAAPAADHQATRSPRCPRTCARRVQQRKVLVLLFYNNRSADDRAVRRELAHVSTYGKPGLRRRALDQERRPLPGHHPRGRRRAVADHRGRRPQPQGRDARRLRRPRHDRPGGRRRASAPPAAA